MNNNSFGIGSYKVFVFDSDKVVIVTYTSPFPNKRLLFGTLKFYNSYTPFIYTFQIYPFSAVPSFQTNGLYPVKV